MSLLIGHRADRWGRKATFLAGFVIVTGGYSTAFLVLAAIALAALFIFLFFMPETKPGEEPVPAQRAAPAQP